MVSAEYFNPARWSGSPWEPASINLNHVTEARPHGDRHFLLTIGGDKQFRVTSRVWQLHCQVPHKTKSPENNDDDVAATLKAIEALLQCSSLSAKDKLKQIRAVVSTK